VGGRRNFVGQHFLARGCWVSTVGKNKAAVHQYIQNQGKEDKRLEQLGWWRFKWFTLFQAAGCAGSR